MHLASFAGDVLRWRTTTEKKSDSRGNRNENKSNKGTDEFSQFNFKEVSQMQFMKLSLMALVIVFGSVSASEARTVFFDRIEDVTASLSMVCSEDAPGIIEHASQEYSKTISGATLSALRASSAVTVTVSPYLTAWRMGLARAMTSGSYQIYLNGTLTFEGRFGVGSDESGVWYEDRTSDSFTIDMADYPGDSFSVRVDYAGAASATCLRDNTSSTAQGSAQNHINYLQTVIQY